jgi:hypothetical protein
LLALRQLCRLTSTGGPQNVPGNFIKKVKGMPSIIKKITENITRSIDDLLSGERPVISG